MRQFTTITINAFMELIRQPVFLLLMSSSAAFGVFLACVPYFGFGDDPKLVKNSVLAVMFLAGLFGAVISASASVAHEIRTGTALAVLAKPVGRVQFLLAKFAGLAGALTLLTYVNLISLLLASRMAFDAYGATDLQSLAFFSAGVGLAYGLGGFSNYFLNRPFVSETVFALVGALTVVLLVVALLSGRVNQFGEVTVIDWRLVPAALLILFALWILAALALACSTRLEILPTLAICTSLFLLGLVSDHFFGRAAEQGAWWASVLYAVAPNWQLFWMADALDQGKTIPWSYLGKALGYVAGYLGASLALALLMFEHRELS